MNTNNHNIYEDTCLHPGIIADDVCDSLQKPNQPYLRETIGPQLEQLAIQQYQESKEFRKKLSACENKRRSKEKDANAALEWLRKQMTMWAYKLLQK